jgi:hypothetical protein
MGEFVGEWMGKQAGGAALLREGGEGEGGAHAQWRTPDGDSSDLWEAGNGKKRSMGVGWGPGVPVSDEDASHMDPVHASMVPCLTAFFD